MFVSTIDASDEKYDDEMQKQGNAYRGGNHVPGVDIMLDGQVAITPENSVKHREVSFSVRGNDDDRCNPMRKCSPGRAKDRIDYNGQNVRSAHEQIFTYCSGPIRALRRSREFQFVLVNSVCQPIPL